jgi:hypothetical protein
MRQHKIGDIVNIKIKRYPDNSGCSTVHEHHPDWNSTPIMQCRIAKIGIAGVSDIFALEFLDGQPVGLPFFEKDFIKTTRGGLVGFFLGESPDDEGRYISDYLNFSDDYLEGCHDFIQWAFPIPERSFFNPQAPLLSPDDIREFTSNQKIQENLDLLFERVFSFMRDSSKNWGQNDHNHLRISRMIRCLRLCGKDNDAARLYLWALSLPPTNTNSTSKNFWATAMRSK